MGPSTFKLRPRGPTPAEARAFDEEKETLLSRQYSETRAEGIRLLPVLPLACRDHVNTQRQIGRRVR